MLNTKLVLTDLLETLKQEIIKEQEAQGRTASGKSVKGYEVVADNDQGTLYGVNYVGTLETGRRGGAVPAGFKDIILQWIDDKRIFQSESESKKKSIAYLIARKIAKEGTLLHRQGGESGVLSDNVTEEKINELTDKLLDSFQNETINTVLFEFAA